MKIKLVILLLMISIGSMLAAVETDFPAENPKPKRNFGALIIGGGVRMVNEGQMQDAYGKNLINYLGELNIFFNQTIAIAIDFGYMTKNGYSSYQPVQEKLKFTMISLELGPKFYLGKKNFRPYVTFSGGYYLIKEEAGLIGNVDKKQFGFAGSLGLEYFLGSKFFLQLKVRYTVLKVETDSSRNLGGAGINCGFGIRF